MLVAAYVMCVISILVAFDFNEATVALSFLIVIGLLFLLDRAPMVILGFCRWFAAWLRRDPDLNPLWQYTRPW